ncbi:hypothetical protein ACX9I7_30325 [Streptomyces sp. L500]
MVLAPGGRVIRRSAADADLPAAFAAQFSLSHGCWLLTYLFVGWLAASAGLPVTAVVLDALALAAALAAAATWPAHDLGRLGHAHTDLPAGHPHLAKAREGEGGRRHSHDFVIDDLHRHWPGARHPVAKADHRPPSPWRHATAGASCGGWSRPTRRRPVTAAAQAAPTPVATAADPVRDRQPRVFQPSGIHPPTYPSRKSSSLGMAGPATTRTACR